MLNIYDHIQSLENLSLPDCRKDIDWAYNSENLIACQFGYKKEDDQIFNKADLFQKYILLTCKETLTGERTFEQREELGYQIVEALGLKNESDSLSNIFGDELNNESYLELESFFKNEIIHIIYLDYIKRAPIKEEGESSFTVWAKHYASANNKEEALALLKDEQYDAIYEKYINVKEG